MKDKVLVTIRNDQVLAGRETGEEALEVVMTGNCSMEGDTCIVRYTEDLVEEGDMTALNTVRIEGSSLQVSKTGDVEVDMYFEAGKRSLAVYATPFGEMEMGISTTFLENSISEDEICVRVGYALSINGTVTADCRMEMRVESLL